MNQFLKKIGLFSLLALFVAILIQGGFSLTGLTKYHWGNPFYAKKISDLKNHQNTNVFFIGSSQFYRHINPIEFDQITNSESYNLGVQGLATPENYYLFEKMLEEENIAPNSTIFLALSGIQSIAPSNFYSERSTYFLNWKIFSSSIRIIFDESRPLKTQIFRIYSFVVNYIYKHLGLPVVRNWLSGFEYQGNNEFVKNKGFLALDDDLEEEYINRGLAFQKMQSPLKSRIEITSNEFKNQTKKGLSNEAHIEKLFSLIQQANEKNINLYFVITPRKKNYKDILPLIKDLPKNFIINLANPFTYPEFYSTENSFDIGHLNKKGAQLFTKKLAEEYLKIKRN